MLVTRILTAPRTPWENDEFLFAEGVRHFDPSRYHPHPPGYPLYILIGKVFAAVLHDPWRALVVAAIVAAPVGFVAIARAFRNWIDDPDLAVCGALVFYFSASMLLHGTLALSDGVSIAFLGLALWGISAVGPAGSRRYQAAPDGASPAGEPPPRQAAPDGVSPAGEPAPRQAAPTRDALRGAGSQPASQRTEPSSQRAAPANQRTAILVGLCCSAAIGCRPQLLVPILPMLAIALWRMATMRQRVACLATFGFVSLMWMLPLIDAAGGLDALVAYETKQAAYVASHDAAMSRGAKSAAQIFLRFVIHPWGSKYVTIPLFAAALLGIPAALRRWRALLPLLVFSAVQLAFELRTMDPADAARYNLPSMIFVALLVALGLDVIRRSSGIRAVPWLGAALFAAASFFYVKPILAARTHGPSPPAAAAAYANAHFPPNTVVLYDQSLRPAAEYLLRFRTESIEKGLAALTDRPDVPAVMLVDGGSPSPETMVFSWPTSDAYGKLTRNLYRQVTLDPVRPDERYLPLAGVYPLERTPEGDEWRWLAREAALRLPRTHGPAVRLAFRLSPDAPYEENTVHVAVNGRAAGTVVARKHAAAAIDVPLPPEPDAVVAVRSEHSFAPATVLRNQDPRLLAVQLVAVGRP